MKWKTSRQEQTRVVSAAILMPYIIASLGPRERVLCEVIIGIYWTKDKQSIKTFQLWQCLVAFAIPEQCVW